jgi:SAM-dependent methyltransferase
MTAYGVVKKIWRATTTQSARDWASQFGMHKWLVAKLESTAEHGEIYDRTYYEQFVEPAMDHSVQQMCATIIRDLTPKAVVDLGCGTGRLLSELGKRGVHGLGIEYSDAAIEKCRQRGVSVLKLDLERQPIPEDCQADVAISTEVAEHLPESLADQFMDALCTIARQHVVLTAAIPGQGGTDHVNEQPNSYWIQKAAERNCVFDEALTAQWRQEWNRANVEGCFANNVMVFHRS